METRRHTARTALSISVLAAMVSVATVSGCRIGETRTDDGVDDNDGSAGGQTSSTTSTTMTSEPSWAIGNWSAPSYETDSTPVMQLVILADGTYERDWGGPYDNGVWTMDGDVLVLDGIGVTGRLPNCTAIHWSKGDLPAADYFRVDYPAACPDAPDALSAAEKCLVGKFDLGESSTTHIIERAAHRTQTELKITASSQKTTTVSQWTLEGSKLCIRTTETNQPACTTVSWADIRTKRTDPPIAGCEYPSDGCDERADDCGVCFDCAITAKCADTFAAYDGHPDKAARSSCLNQHCGCGGEVPCNPPPNCADVCDSMYPSAAAASQAFDHCIACDCPNACQTDPSTCD